MEQLIERRGQAIEGPAGLPPAGWYPDPERRGARFWNGERWTLRRAAVAGRPAPGLAPPNGPPPMSKTAASPLLQRPVLISVTMATVAMLAIIASISATAVLWTAIGVVVSAVVGWAWLTAANAADR